MQRVSDRDWQDYVEELRGLKSAMDRIEVEATPSARRALRDASRAVKARVGPDQFRSVVLQLDMLGDDLIEGLAGYSPERAKPLADFGAAVLAVEWRDLLDECARSVNPDEASWITQAFLDAKSAGEDLFARCEGDAKRVVALLLDRHDETGD